MPYQQSLQQLVQLYPIFDCLLDSAFTIIKVNTAAVIAVTFSLKALVVTVAKFLLEVISLGIIDLEANHFHRSYWQPHYPFLHHFKNFIEHLRHFIVVLLFIQ